jgi:hypothetical protein
MCIGLIKGQAACCHAVGGKTVWKASAKKPILGAEQIDSSQIGEI